MFNKKAQKSLGLIFFIGLFLIFVTSIIYVMTNQITTKEILPISENLIDDSSMINETQKQDLKEENNKFMDFWHTLPFIFVILGVVYMIVKSITRGDKYRF